MRKHNHTSCILPKNGADKRVNNFLWRTTKICRYFLTPCTNKVHEDKNIKQMNCYTQEIGRSMVEMLGVLAIIGVLSVGGIAGYSKAMEKYRLNKHAQSFNLLLNASLQYSAQLKGSGFMNNENSTEYYAETLKHLNAIPDGIKYVANTTLKDIYGNNISVFSNASGNFGMALRFGDNKGNEQVCANYVKTAKENHSELERVYMQQFSGGTHTSGIGIMYGDKYCDKNKSCLRNLTLENISTLCNSCIDDCTLYIVW